MALEDLIIAQTQLRIIGNDNIMSISAAQIKQLRDATDAPMMLCKKALTEAGGDFEAAKDWLRKEGGLKAAKKSERITAEGLVSVKVEGNKGVIVEINSETDFVAKNDQFQSLVTTITETAFENNGDETATKSAHEQTITDAVATIGENISFRRSAGLSTNQGAVISYVHNAAAEGLGKIGVLVALESAADTATLESLGKKLAMHIAASKPAALNRDGVDQSLIEKEKEIFTEQARASGKPDNIIEKMVVGRINKFYEEITLLDQAYIIDPKQKIREVVESAGKEAGSDITISGYVQFTLGEGIEKKEENFAEEVAKTAGAA